MTVTEDWIETLPIRIIGVTHEPIEIGCVMITDSKTAIAYVYHDDEQIRLGHFRTRIKAGMNVVSSWLEYRYENPVI